MTGETGRILPGTLLGAALMLMAACSPPPATYEDSPDPAMSASEEEDYEAAAEEAEALFDEDMHADEDDEEEGENDHDHDHDAHAGGEAHVHGAAELAVTLDGTFVTVTIDAPLANFGLSEKTKKKASEMEQYADGLTELMGDAHCDIAERSAEIRRNGDHAALTLSIAWDCRRPSQLDGLMFTGFETYEGFETVEAVYLGEDEQSAAVLTPGNPFLPF